MNERWLPVVGFEGRYEVSDMGQVRGLSKYSNHKGNSLKCMINNHGYPFVWLYKDGKQFSKRPHILVMRAFVGPAPEGMQVNHIDCDKLNPRLDNLEYVTAKENHDQARRNNLLGQALTPSSVHTIRKLRDDGMLINDIASHLGVSRGTIFDVLQGRTWTHL